MSTHSQVAHAWANRTGRYRKGYNVFHEQDVIYSYGYHFPIAKIVEKNGGPVVLITNRSYSVSTANHISHVTRAVRHMATFTVSNPTKTPDGDDVIAYLEQVANLCDMAKRARKYTELYSGRAKSLLVELQQFIKIFEIPGYEGQLYNFDEINSILEKMTEERQQRELAARNALIEGQRRHYRQHQWPLLKAWLRGLEGARAPKTSSPVPRIVGDEVQTSWGATFPLEDAKKLYWKAVQCRRSGQEYKDRRGRRMGDYVLNKIKANGNIVIACHEIPFWFMRYTACRNNIPSQPAHS